MYNKYCYCDVPALEEGKSICSKCGFIIISIKSCLYCKKIIKSEYVRGENDYQPKYCSRKCYSSHKKILIAEGKLKMPEKDFRYRADLIRGKTFIEYYGEEKAKEIGKRLSDGRRGKPHPTTHRWSEEEKERRRREILDDPVRMKKIREVRAQQVFPFYNSSIEILVRGMLDAYGIKYVKHKWITDIEHTYICDIYIPTLNIIVECDGDYFHRFTSKSDRDKLRNIEIRDKGYILLRFWETTIRKHPEYICQTIEKILKIISQDHNPESVKELLDIKFNEYKELMKERNRTAGKRWRDSHKEEIKEKTKQKTQERIEYRTINNIKFECQQCHKEFVPKERNFKRRPPKYCSKDCMNKVISKIGANYMRTHDIIRPSKKINDCPECLKLESGFCSSKCRDRYVQFRRYWRNKGVDFKYQNETRTITSEAV